MHTSTPLLSWRLKERLIALMEAGRFKNESVRLPMLLEHGRYALEELKEVIQLEAINADLLEALVGIRDLARTGTAPMAFNMTPRDWDTHKINKIAGEAHQAIEKATHKPE